MRRPRRARLTPARARLAAYLGAAALTCATAGVAFAAPCGAPDLLDTVPAGGAVGIAINASLLAHYAPSAEYLDEDVTFGPDGGDPQTASVSFDPTQGILALTPDQPLSPDTAYVVRWPALRGISTAAQGLGADVGFTTGHDPDAQPPVFDGVSGLRWDLERKQNDCTDDIEERFVFDLDLGAADDDGGRDALTLVVFQTASPAFPDQSVPVLTRAIPPAGGGARVGLTVGGNVGRVCFAAVVRDLTGKSSSSGSQESCVETTQPPFFAGCGVAPGAVGGAKAGGSRSAVMSALVVALLVAARGGRRRRRARGSVSGDA